MTYGRFFRPEIETAAPEVIRRLQEEKLRRQLQYVYANSPFYQRKFAAAGLKPEDIRTIEDLRYLPFTEKDELRQSQVAHPPLGDYAAVPMKRVVRIVASSGTTGRPSYIGVTEADRRVWLETVSRVCWSQGVRPDSVAVVGFRLGMFVGGLPLQQAIEHIGATCIPIGTGESYRLVEAIREFGADTLFVTPSYAIYLAEYVRKQFGLEPRSLGLRRIHVGGEPGGGIPHVRHRLEEEWGAMVTEGIGNADVLPIYAAECEEQKGMHFLAPDFLILEVIDPETGTPLSLDQPEVRGELVFTHVEREGMPLVRFRTRDHVVVWTGSCPCGRTGVRIRCVGRTDDMLIVRGVNVWPSAVRDVIMSQRPATTGEIQILLTEPGPQVTPPLRVQVEHGEGVPDLEQLKEHLERLLRERLMVQAAVELVPPGTLPRYEMKAQLIRRLYKA